MKFFTILLAGVIMVYAADPTPVGWWHFSEGSGSTLTDASGCSNTGTIHGAEWVAGMSGKELSFDGADDYVDCGSDPILLPADQLSLSLWVKPDKWEDQGRIITKPTNPHGQSGYYDYYALFCRGDADLNFRLTINGQDVLVFSTTGNVKIDEWNHIAAVYDGSCMKLYINDTLAGANDYVSGSLSYDDTPLCLGNSPYMEGEAYSGLIDEAAVYNAALDSVQIHAIYEENRVNNTVIPSITVTPIPSPTKNRRPEFKWSAVSGASSYSIVIGTTERLDDPLVNIPVSGTSFTPSIDLPLGMIYWRGKSDKSGYSQLSSFEIHDPTVPSLIPYTPKITVERTPTLCWNTVSGASSYTVQVADNVNFSGCRELTAADTFVTVSDTLPIGDIFWRVKSDLSDTWSKVDHFQINDNTVSTLIRFNGAVISTLTPTLRWFNVLGAQFYTVQWGQERDFSNGFSFPVSDTSYTVPSLSTEGKWFWRVKSDVETEYPPADSFIVKLTPITNYYSKPVPAQITVSSKDLIKSVEITIGIPQNGKEFTLVTLLDIAGRTIAQESFIGKGFHRVVYSKGKLPCGVYIVRVLNGASQVNKKLIIK
ncbi:LamG-like jellyroll fold domain-containing protein [Fibrobacterota bacterium]